MPLIIFSFSFNPETQEAAFAGNIEPQLALQLLQQLTIAEMVRREKEKPEGKKDETKV